MKTILLALLVTIIYLPVFAQSQLPKTSLQREGTAKTTGGIEIGTITGTAWIVTSDGNRAPIQSGQKVSINVQFETGAESALELFLSNGATVILQSNSRVQIPVFVQNPGNIPATNYDRISKEPSFSRLQVIVISGAAVIDGARLNSLSSLEVQTSMFSATSSNGVLSVASNQLGFSVGVVTGNVQVRQLNSLSSPISLNEGERVTINITTEAGPATVRVETSKMPPTDQMTAVELLQNGGAPLVLANSLHSSAPGIPVKAVVDDTIRGTVRNLSPIGEALVKATR
jgi:hypothetical protein